MNDTTESQALAWAHANLPSDPMTVVAALEHAGWVRIGARTDVYIRLGRPGDRNHHLVVPLRPEFGDYPDLMAGVLATLFEMADTGRRADQALAQIAAPGRADS